MKLDNLHPEMIMVYVFPLHKIDLIFSLPWLQKHNLQYPPREKAQALLTRPLTFCNFY